jgi:Fungal specific transcription factor domain
MARIPETHCRGTDLSNIVYKSFPWQPASNTNPTTAYFVPLVLSDPVLFHATLQLTSMRLEDTPVDKSQVQSNKLTLECIRLLRDRVEKSDVAVGVSDTTISAVATLASIEVCDDCTS